MSCPEKPDDSTDIPQTAKPTWRPFERSRLRALFQDEQIFVEGREFAKWVLDFTGKIIMVAAFNYFARKSENWFLLAVSWFVSVMLYSYVGSYFWQLLSKSTGLWAYDSRAKRIFVVLAVCIVVGVIVNLTGFAIDRVAELQKLK